MSKAEILAELPKLTESDREEIRHRLAELDRDGWLDEDDPLSAEEKALIEARISAHEKDPKSAIPWEEFQKRLPRETSK